MWRDDYGGKDYETKRWAVSLYSLFRKNLTAILNNIGAHHTFGKNISLTGKTEILIVQS